MAQTAALFRQSFVHEFVANKSPDYPDTAGTAYLEVQRSPKVTGAHSQNIYGWRWINH